jgi:hypothetical protein
MVTKKTHIGLLRLRRHRAEQSQACRQRRSRSNSYH